jgi:8-oxo-dGTP pyrophosphatase MutT (NUDIX family)
MTVDREDLIKEKEERLRGTEFEDLEKIHLNMLTFPGGKVEERESPFQAMIREFREETGLKVAAARLHQLQMQRFEVEQSSKKGERRGSRIFRVLGFHYQLSKNELVEIEEHLAPENRSLTFFSWSVAVSLIENGHEQIRPASRGLLNAAKNR